MTKKHIHCDLIKAWADGAEIEFKYPNEDSWKPAPFPYWNPDQQYRVKPKPVTKWYRVGIMKYPHGDSLAFACSTRAEEILEINRYFSHWSGERQYVEVE